MVKEDSNSPRAPNEKTAREQLAINLRVLRLLHGWSQEALAAAAEVDRSYIGGIERGERNVSLDNLERLAQAFGLTIPDLLQPMDSGEVGRRFMANLQRKTTG